MTKFFDAATKPPKGGWHFNIGGVRVEKYSESEILAELRKWRQNNGTYKGEDALVAELWTYYCGREPQRCKFGEPTVQAITPQASAVSRDLTPAVYGPWIWRFLNLAAVKFDREFFLRLCDQIIVMLDCPLCREEWRHILATEPPITLSDAREACEWVNRNHNRVNAKLGKQLFSYAQMMSEYGAP